MGDGYILLNADKQRIRSRLLLQIDLPTILRYVEGVTPVHADGFRWSPYPFRPPDGMGSQTGELSGVTSIELPANAALLAAHYDGTLEDATIHVLDAWFDPLSWSQLAEETIELSVGRIDEPVYDMDEVMFSFGFDGAGDLRAIFAPQRKIVPRCAFILGGPGCQSNGTATSCNQAWTLTGCMAPDKVSPEAEGGNTRFYGGFLEAT